MQAFSSSSERRLLSSWVGVCGLLIAVAFLVLEHGLYGMQALVVEVHGLSSCGSQA